MVQKGVAALRAGAESPPQLATNALEAGVNIAVVSKFLGHTDIKTTARFYLRPEIASLKEAQSIWERALIGQ